MAQEPDTSVIRQRAIAEFEAGAMAEMAFQSILQHIQSVQPDAVMVAWEKDGEISMATYPKSRMFAKGMIIELFELFVERDEE